MKGRFGRRWRERRDECADCEKQDRARELPKIAIVGNPNVGKSVLFGNLTGAYATVSNYPGTTVDVTRGAAKLGDFEFEVIDTPGMYSFSPITEEERVARRILIDETPSLAVHVIDAKNLERMLPMTFQLIEAGFPTILVLNIMDEAARAGVEIDTAALEREMGIPVIPAVSTTRAGMTDLEAKIRERATGGAVGIPAEVDFPTGFALDRIERLLEDKYGISRRATALLLLEEDWEIMGMVAERQAPAAVAAIQEIIKEVKARYSNPAEFEIALRRRDRTNAIIERVVVSKESRTSFAERLSGLMMNPLTGFPILLAVLYLGLYKFVGNFGAGTVVDLIEGRLFEQILNPIMIDFFTEFVPWAPLRDLLVGEYGVLTLGLRYAVALVLPIVTFFFIVFSIVEDSGYLPRLAMLIDTTFKRIGLSGRAVIPMVLGFGCDTMATVVTRTLPSVRERLIATMLLALAIPCSAQLGLIMALLQDRPAALLVWVGVITLVFLFVGFLTAKLLPGVKPSFYMEIPPLRLPNWLNVITKTYVRVKWYLKEIIPLFILASFLIWIGNLTGLFGFLVGLLETPVALIGLPDEAASAFLFGFFRRDYGAAGLFDLHDKGLLTGNQLVVASVALTLFLPCIAQFIINIKERGWKTGVGISVFVLFFSFGVAYAVNAALVALGVSL